MAQFGVGYWGPNLLRNLVAENRCEVVGVAELSSERRTFVQQKFPGVPVVESHEELLARTDIDAVVIATPANTHFDIAMQALNAGKHVLIEKPMGKTVSEVEQIGMLAKQRGLVAMVGHTFLYSSPVRYLRDLVNSGELGQVRYLYSQRLNLGRIRPDIDALWNLAPHDISIIQYLFGDPTPLTVSRCGMDYVQRGIEDVVFLNIVYPNKIFANIHVSWLDPQRVRKMIVVGSEKMVIYDDAAERKIAVYDKGIDRMAVLGENMDYDKPSGAVFSHRSGEATFPEVAPNEPLQAEIGHYLDCIADGVECITGVDHAVKVTKILSLAGTGGSKALS